MQKEENEIRVKAGNPATPYINRAATLLLREQDALDFIVFKASGKAIHTSLIACDVIRRKIGGLHQINRISSITVSDRRKNSSGEEQDIDRSLSIFEIVLTKKPTESQKKEVGYIGVLAREENAKDSTLQEIVERRRRQVRNYSNNNNNNNNRQRRRDDGEQQTQRRPYQKRQYNDEDGNRKNYNNDNKRRYNNDNRNNSRRENYNNSRRNNNGGNNRSNNRSNNRKDSN